MNASDSGARLRLLYELGTAFAARIELDDLIPLVITKCREVLDAEGISVLLLDGPRNELYFPYVAEEDPDVAAALRGLRFPADRGIAGAVVQNGKAVRVDDAASDPRFYRDIDRDTGFTTRTMLCAPLTTHQETVGVIQAVNRRGGGVFSDEDLDFLEGIAGSVAVALENARLYAEVKAKEELLRAQVGALRRDLARRDQFSEIIGTGPAMREMFRLMESAAASPITVLIEGETGTGKELVARGIHKASARAEAPFIAVNCAAVTETLLESELFGHRKGAFTGAHQEQRGLFEAAGGGTIFLDEIGEMPAAMQAKLLRVLQEGEIVPVGDTRPRKVDVRVISATNRDLAAEVTRRTFRQDLFYRVAAFPIRLPALRERCEDIPLLADLFLSAAAQRHKKRLPGIAPEALEGLVRFDWPGNVRELQNEIERAVALSRDGELIGVAQLSPKVVASHTGGDAVADASAHEVGSVRPSATNGSAGLVANGTRFPVGDLRAARDEFEKIFIAQALRENGGNISRTARVIGLSRVMLQRKMKEFGLRDMSYD